MPDSAIQEIVCCVGHPQAGNPTQFLMQRALADAGLDWCCLTLEVAADDLRDALCGVRALGFKGVNLNPPHKIAACALMDSLSESAELMGAVNCIRRMDDHLHGENTDGEAFVQSLEGVLDVAGSHVLLFGAGGAARAIAVQLAQAGAAEIRVANRTQQRAESLAALLSEKLNIAASVEPWEESIAVAEDIQLVVNATSIGHLDADAMVPVHVPSLRPSLVVADVIVNPPHTWLLSTAAACGCQTVNGLSMLVHQAVLNFRLWTGLEPDPGVIREAVEEFLEV